MAADGSPAPSCIREITSRKMLPRIKKGSKNNKAGVRE